MSLDFFVSELMSIRIVDWHIKIRHWKFANANTHVHTGTNVRKDSCVISHAMRDRFWHRSDIMSYVRTCCFLELADCFLMLHTRFFTMELCKLDFYWINKTIYTMWALSSYVQIWNITRRIVSWSWRLITLLTRLRIVSTAALGKKNLQLELYIYTFLHIYLNFHWLHAGLWILTFFLHI